MTQLWIEKFEVKPGRWIFVPSQEGRAEGTKIKTEISRRWVSPDYMYQFRPGGHIAALKKHLPNSSFVRLDIKDCFGSINRSRVTRCLKNLVGYQKAREWTTMSVVRSPAEPLKWVLPFGFVQSPILAALCISEGALGSCLRKIHEMRNVVLTVYVDDIIASTREDFLTQLIREKIEAAISRSRFEINMDKSMGPGSSITAFNIIIEHQKLVVHPDRLKQFSAVINSTSNPARINGIRSYVGSVNSHQILQL
jgi:hypothetical protein